MAEFGLELDRLKINVGELDPKLQRALLGVVQYWDGPIERSMKHNAPWHDRTTNARNGLAARGTKDGDGKFVITLSHGVSYGIYLERGTRFMRARPIIIPTIDEFGPKVLAFCSKLLDRLRAGA